MDFSPDGKAVLTILGYSIPGNAAIDHWQAQLREAVTLNFLTTIEGIQTTAFSLDGRTLLTWTGDSQQLWELTTGKRLDRYAGPHGREGEGISRLGRLALLRGNLAAWVTPGTETPVAELWDSATGKRLGPLLGGLAVVSPDRRTLMTGVLESNSYTEAQFWDLTPVLGETELLMLWVQVLTRRELGDGDQVRQLDEATWEQRRQRLEDSIRSSPVSDFVASVAKDRDYWKRQEAKEK
jgi:hypothetical protein